MQKVWRRAALALALVLTVSVGRAAEDTFQETPVTVEPGENVVITPEGETVPENETAPEGETTPEETAPPVPVVIDPGIFTDVPAEAWYANAVNLAAMSDLLKGVGNDCFAPMGKVTLGQAVTIAARIYADHRGVTVPESDPGEAWYLGAYRYCLSVRLFTAEEVPQEDLERVATRFELVDVLDRAVPDAHMTAIRQVSDWDITDLSEQDAYGPVVYKWRRAGIIEGDQNGAFGGDRDITRAEMAAILCRLTGEMPRV